MIGKSVFAAQANRGKLLPGDALLACATWFLFMFSLPVATSEPNTVVGFTSAFYDAELGTSLPGIVRDIKVEEGQSVKKDEVLVVFEHAQEDLEVERRKLIWEDKSQLESARQRLATIKKDVESTRQLYESSRSVRRDELEKKELELKLTEAHLQQMSNAENREEIEYHMALGQQKLRSITAPADGLVIKIYVEMGEYAQQLQPLVRLVNLDQCYLTCNVTAPVSARFKKGENRPIEFALPQGPVTKQGKVTLISSVVDPASGLKEIKLIFDNTDMAISPGIKGTLLLQ